MKQGTMKILFFVLKTKLLKNGEAPILMRITINGQYEETRIQRSVPLKLWNAAKGCSKGKDRASNELNSYLSELATRALEKYKELILEQAISTPSLILKRVFGKDTEMRTLLGAIRQEIKEMEKVVNIDYAPVTINRYKNVLKKLENSIPTFYDKEDITFHELTPEFIKAFDLHLKTEVGLCRNTIVRYMKCFKKITNMALAKGWMKKDAFYGYKMEQDETAPVFLTYNELQTVMNKEFTIPRLALVRDIFIFACFTGLAFVDVSTLKKEDMVQDNNGDWWIRKGRIKLMHQRKASSICNIPLLPVPLAILKKYENNPVCIKKGYCLPVPCNQKMNSYLKEIADFCGIKKNITTHTARHTFGTTITLANNVPLQDVSVMLGHASTRMTQHYARVMNASLKKSMIHVKEQLTQ
jgi:integrase